MRERSELFQCYVCKKWLWGPPPLEDEIFPQQDKSNTELVCDECSVKVEAFLKERGDVR